ncbi:MAG: M20/M25/M40 family metallo-hydrolase, partial [Anaeromyxobacteraceae bacterium]
LADPARTGRGVGTPGIDQAADWIEARMRDIGLAPAGAEGFRQVFEAPVGARLLDGNGLVLGGKEQKLGTDWQPFTFSDDGKVDGEIVFAGYGITAPELAYDDYAGLDVKGKIVLVAQDFPAEQDQKSPFRDPKNYRYGEWRYKVTNARDHGAAAVLAVRDDWNHPEKDEIPPWKGSPSSRAGLVAARVTLAALQGAGIDAVALAVPIGSDLKPRSKALGVKAEVQVAVAHDKARTANLVGKIVGSDPAVAGECVIVGAHYDHLGFGGESSAAPDQVGKVHLGADDNASGTAAMLEIARAFRQEAPPRRTVVFVAFSGEELGVLGSAHFVKNPPEGCPVARMQLMVNLDMVGRPQQGKMYVHGVDTAKGLRDTLREQADRAPPIALKVEVGGDGFGSSDNTSFYAKDVPVLYLFNGAHTDYHRVTDSADKIDPLGLAEAARLGWRAARDAADWPTRLEVVKVAQSKPQGGGGGRGSRPSLGTIPDFAERKDPGVLLTGVIPGSPAQKAGLAAGDVVLRLGTKRILNLEDMQYALTGHRPGDVVELEYARDGKVTVVQVTLAERK